MGTNKIKAPAVMIAAIRDVQPGERISAARYAEKFYARALARLNAFGDFSTERNAEMAAEATAAEIAFRFA